LYQVRLVPNIPRKYSIAKEQLSFLSMKNLIVLRKSETSKAKIMSKNRDIESVNSPKKSGIQEKKMQKYKSMKTGIHNQEASEDSERKCSECWEKQLQKTNVDDWIECVICRNWLPEFCSKTNASAAAEDACQRKTEICRTNYIKFRSLQTRLSSMGSSIVYL
jgi:hypothetical protein